MAVFPTLNHFVMSCRETRSRAKLWRNSLDFVHERGVRMVSYHSDDAQVPGSPPLGLVEDGFPKEWVCKYIEKNLSVIDPVPHLASVMTRPFLWSQVPELMKMTPGAKKYMRQLAASGLGDGLAMQVYGPRMRNAYVGMGFGRTEVELTPEEIFELQCAAQIAHIRYCELTEHKQTLSEELSPREIEILRWIARGKSTSVIADILGISRHTVDTITRRIFEKLNVNDRTTAAIRGLGSGLIRHRRGEVV